MSVGNIVCEADEFLIQTHVVVIDKHILVSGFYDVPTPVLACVKFCMVAFVIFELFNVSGIVT